MVQGTQIWFIIYLNWMHPWSGVPQTSLAVEYFRYEKDAGGGFGGGGEGKIGGFL